MALRASSGDLIGSSRQIGVLICALQLGVVDDVVVRQRLFEHHQVEFVEAFEQVDVGERVRRVRIAHQQDIAELRPHGLDHVVIPRGADLDLDAFVTGVELGADLVR